MQYYNIHSHIFTMRNAPERFLQLYMPDAVANTLDAITNTEAGAQSVAWLLSKLPSNVMKRFSSLLRIGKSNDQEGVFRKLTQNYDDQSFRFVALSMYMEHCGAGPSETNFDGQLAGVEDVKKKYPDNLLVFFGLDPRWKASGKELRKEIERQFNRRLPITSSRSVYPFVGIKLYPSTGFYVFDERLKETLEWAADNGVPVLSHCNYLGGIYNNDSMYVRNNLNPIDVYENQRYGDLYPQLPKPEYDQRGNFGSWLLGRNKPNRNKYSCSYFLEPLSYKSTINYFTINRKFSGNYSNDTRLAQYYSNLNSLQNLRTPLKICLAHFGGDQHILVEERAERQNTSNTFTAENSFSSRENTNWCGQIRQLMRDYPTVYTDISYALANKKIHQFILKELDDQQIGNRIMFGTDFFLTEKASPEKDNYNSFRSLAVDRPLSNFNNISAWDQIASKNPETFLISKFYDGNVI